MQHSNRNQFRTLLDNVNYPAILSLDFKPLEWVHSDWLKDIPFIKQFQALTSPAIHAYVRQHLGLGNRQLTQFNEPLTRLILLPYDRLMHLLTVIGLSCFQQQISLLIDQKTKRSLIDLIGISALHLLKNKLPLMIKAYPESLKCRLPLLDEYSHQLRAFHLFGLQLLLHAVEEHQSDWHKLLLLKLPDIPALPKSVSISRHKILLSKTEHARLRLLIQKITLEIYPECMTLVK